VATHTFTVLLDGLIIVFLLEKTVARVLVRLGILLRCDCWASRVGLVRRWRRGAVIMTCSVGNGNGKVGLGICLWVGRSGRASATNGFAINIHRVTVHGCGKSGKSLAFFGWEVKRMRIRLVLGSTRGRMRVGVTGVGGVSRQSGRTRGLC
jgi:hypothetical protein